MANKIQLRRDTSSNWSSGNPTLSQGELGHETNTGKLKVGDGSTAWNSLGYVDTTYTSSNFTHDDLTGFVANEHIDWTADQGSTNIHAGNYTDTTYTHPNHSGEVTSTADGATVISDNVVDEANLKVSNSPTNGYVLTAQSGNTGGLTWAAAASGGGDPDLYRDNASSATTPVASAANGVAIGNGASSAGSSSSGVAIGLNATVGAGTGGVALGESYVGNTDAMAFAMNSTSSSYGALGARSVAGAGLAKASGSGSIALGYGSQSTNSISVAIGQNSTSTAANALALGYNSSATTADSISLGGSATSVKVSGAYTLPTADGSANQVLTTNGSGVASWAAASGGGGADLYAANESSPSAQPSATGTNAVAIGDSAVSGGERSMALTNSYASGVDAFAAAIANNSSAYGAKGNFSIAMGQNAVTQSNFQVAIGNGATGASTSNNAVALGQSYVSGADSLSAAIANNSSSYGALHDNGVALGYQATTTAAKQIALGSSTAQVKVSGAFTLPTADGSANQVLTAAGDGSTSWAAASGGGGGASSIDDLSDAEWDGSNLSIGTNSFSAGSSHYRNVAIGWNTGNSSITTGDDNVLIGRNTGSYVTTGTANTAVGQNALQSTNLDKLTGSDNVGIGQTAGSSVTSGSGNTFVGSNTNGTGNVNYQTALGYNAKTAGAGATAINNSYASGADSFAAAIGDNTSSYGAQGANSVALGYRAKVTDNNGIALDGGWADSGGCLAWSTNAKASFSRSIALGYNAFSNADNAIALGSNSLSDVKGKIAFSNFTIAPNWSQGSAQSGQYTLGCQTSDATATTMTSDNSASVSSNNQVRLHDHEAVAFDILLVARQDGTDGTACAAWKVVGLINRASGAGTTTLVTSATTVINNTPNWGTPALSADTTNGNLKVQVTGAASTDIAWVATVTTSELTHA